MPRPNNAIQYLDTGYAVSRCGEVTNIKTGKRLKPQNNGCGYLFVRIKDKFSGIYKSAYVHRMVCQVFVNSDLSDLTVNHKDGDTKNNYFENLELISREENTRLAQEKCFSVSSPEGNNFVVTGLRNFCRENNINHQSMVLVAQGKINNHRGWGCSYV